MMKDGLCLVVSPLIALMKDQVANLQQRGIKALSITSENRHTQVDALFDRCIFEDIKFLYLSPERLQTDLAKTRIAKMKLSMIAVDEAHCISEWGYDFRPSYLKIADIRKLHPKVPVVALTASATPPVVKDIQEKLCFAQPNVFQKSFARENLRYFVEYGEDKLGKTIRIAQKQGGSGIIYLRSRKGCERVARELTSRGISAAHYHAGLNTDHRSDVQKQWMEGKVQIMVATNAFGMGIDKPDVRFVLHYSLPDTLENYYQECGRAGRDGKKAFAVSLITNKDLKQFQEKIQDSFPSKKIIREVYDKMGSHLKLAHGSGLNESFQVDLEAFAKRHEWRFNTVQRSIQFLEREGYWMLEDHGDQRSTVQVMVPSDEVMNFLERKPKSARVLNALLRSYTRLFDEPVSISEWMISRRVRWSKAGVIEALKHLDQLGIIAYEEGSNEPRLKYLCERLPVKNVRLSAEHYELRKHVIFDKAQAMLHYVSATNKCRSRMILEYFGDSDATNCGHCDHCMKEISAK